MILSILQDSVILFLLIYAVIDLGHRLFLFAMRHLERQTDRTAVYFVADSTHLTADTAEYAIRSALLHTDFPMIVLSETPSDELRGIFHTLSREYEQLHICTKDEFIHRLTTGTVRNVFLKIEETEAPSHSK